jgi:hypothetical protein
MLGLRRQAQQEQGEKHDQNEYDQILGVHFLNLHSFVFPYQ